MEKLKIEKLFSREIGRADNYRIPSIITTDEGRVVACADERFYTASDNPNRIDKVVRYTDDSGKSWSDMIIANEEVGKERLLSSASIDPAMLYDSDTKTLFMIACHTPAGVGILRASKGLGEDEKGRKFVFKGKEKFIVENNRLIDLNGQPTVYEISDKGDITQDGNYICNINIYDGEFREQDTFFLYIYESKDGGESWSKPKSLNYQVKDKSMNFIGAGPGVGTQVKNGKYKGRLIFPIYYSKGSGGILMESCCCIYSDDHGKTWQRGVSPNNTRMGFNNPLGDRMTLPGHRLSEAQLIELKDGTLRMFMRNHSAKRLIAIAESYDGGNTWNNFRYHSQLTQCICQCSVINADYQGKVVTIFLNSASKKKRENGVIRLSFDYGETFEYSRQLKDGEFVYSSMCQMPDGDIGVLYEPSTQHETLDFVKVPIEWIMQGKKEESNE